MFTTLKRSDRDFVMLLPMRRDTDGIDGWIVENLAVVSRCHINRKFIDRFSEPFRISIR